MFTNLIQIVPSTPALALVVRATRRGGMGSGLVAQIHTSGIRARNAALPLDQGERLNSSLCWAHMAAPWKAEFDTTSTTRHRARRCRVPEEALRRPTRRPPRRRPCPPPCRLPRFGEASFKSTPPRARQACPHGITLPYAITTHHNNSVAAAALMNLGLGYACVVPAQAAFVCRLGPLAFTSCASCEFAKHKTLNRNFRSKA